MICFRLWEIRIGKIPFPHDSGLVKKFHVLEEWEKKIWEESKQWSMRFLSLFLRLISY